MQLVFDIGGTHMRLALADNGKLASAPTIISTPKEYNTALAEFARLSKLLAKDEPLTACAGGIAGPLNRDQSQLVAAPNLPDWINKPLKADLEKLLNCPVILQNDTAIGALGEAHFGAGQGYGIVAYMAIGTGVGGCRVVNGAIDENSQGFEPGAQLIAQSLRTATSLEDLVSGTAINKNYQLPPNTELKPQQQDEVCWNLAIGLHNLIMLWSPDIIVLGGGVIDNELIDLDAVSAYIIKLMDKFPFIPTISPSQLKETAGLHGALSLLR